MPSLPPPDSQLSKAADRSEVGLRKRGVPVAEVVPDVHRYLVIPDDVAEASLVPLAQ